MEINRLKNSSYGVGAMRLGGHCKFACTIALGFYYVCNK